MDIHLCSMPQSLMENLRRECANRHCQQKRPRHCVPAPAEHPLSTRHLPEPCPGPAKSLESALGDW